MVTAALALAGCSGAGSPVNTTGEASSLLDATTGADAHTADATSPDVGAPSATAPDGGADASIAVDWPPDGGIFLDGSCPYSTTWSSDSGAAPGDAGAGVPPNHRPAALCCPAARPAGDTCEWDAALPATECLDDSDCTGGTNGRCMILPGMISPPGFPVSDGSTHFILVCDGFCTYDQCFSDVDCPDNVPCICRSYGYGNNVCAIGSGCSVDSDCGPGGSCTFTGKTYQCHRPGDVCFTSNDCPAATFGDDCEYVTSTGAWACVIQPAPPE
jgi:hypothetical protein